MSLILDTITRVLARTTSSKLSTLKAKMRAWKLEDNGCYSVCKVMPCQMTVMENTLLSMTNTRDMPGSIRSMFWTLKKTQKMYNEVATGGYDKLRLENRENIEKITLLIQVIKKTILDMFKLLDRLEHNPHDDDAKRYITIADGQVARSENLIAGACYDIKTTV